MYVYVFRYKELVKIGVSSDPERRVKAFPFMKIESAVKSECPLETEAHLHNMFRKYCVGGEFFSFPEVDIQRVVKELKDVETRNLDLTEVMFGEYICYVAENGFVNITDLLKKIFAKNEEYNVFYSNNILKKKALTTFISEFENEFDYSPVYKIHGRNGGTFVHPFLLNEIILSLGYAQEKVFSYEFLFHTAIIKKGV